MFKKIFGKNNDKSKDELFDFDTLLETAWLEREQEFQHQLENNKLRGDNNNLITLGLLLSKTFDVRKQELSNLRISMSNDSYIIEDKEDIWNFDLIKPLTGFREDNSKYFNQEHVVLNMSYRNYDSKKEDIDKSISRTNGCIIIHLSGAGGVYDKSVYVEATICFPPIKLERGKKGILPQAETLSLLLAYDYWSANESFSKYNLAKEALFDKLKNQKHETLTKVEWSLLENIKPNIGKDFFWGKRVMAEHRYLDAIAYFEIVFKVLQDKWLQELLSEEETDMLREASFLIGFSYMELKNSDKAFKFLNFSYGYKNIIKYKEEYINCLTNSKDIRAIYTIDNCLDDLYKINSDVKTDEESSFLHFLYRRKAYVLIDMLRYIDAMEILNKLLEFDPDNPIIINEINYIKELQKNE